MVVFVIFLIINIFMIVIYMAVYGKKPRYENGMLLGVHIPEYGVHDPEAEAMMEKYSKNLKLFYTLNFVAAIAVSFLAFWYMSIFIIAWSLWIAEVTALAMGLQFRAHRKLYDLKVARGWRGTGGSTVITVDTQVTAEGGRLSYPIWWHVPVIAGEAVPFLLPNIRRLFVKSPDILFLYGCVGAVTLLCICLHVWTVKRRNQVLSGNTEINKRINQLDKKTWSVIWIISNYINLLSLCCIVCPLFMGRPFIGLDIAGFVALQSAAGLVIIFGALCLRWKKQDIIKEDAAPLCVDDDIYWKNGWYNNPADKRAWVQDRFCSINNSANMARKSMKIFTFGTLGAVLILLIVLSVMFLKMDFTPRYMTLDRGSVKISAPFYPLTFKLDEIKEVKLLDKLPEGNFTRTNGLADDRQLVGKFKKQGRDYRVYVYRGYTPILKIELPEYTILLNSRKKGQTQQWYEELS